MKTINEKFTDEEYENLKKVKDKKSWHDFIYSLVKKKNGSDIEEYFGGGLQ